MIGFTKLVRQLCLTLGRTKMLKALKFAILPLPVILTILIACGGGSSDTSPAPTATSAPAQQPVPTTGETSTGEGVRVIEVSQFLYWMEPEPIELKVGEPVQFRITSLETEHTFTVKALGLDEVVGIRKTVLSRVVTPQTAGSFDIICKRHRSKLSRTEGRFPQLIVTEG